MTNFFDETEHRVGPSGHPLRPPSELCVRVSPHTAQAFQWTSLSSDAPVGQARREERFVPDSNLCHTNQRPTCSAILMPVLRRTNRRTSIVICISQGERFHRFSDNERPDRRGHIRSITDRHWLVRSSPCRLPWACLAVGLPWTSQGGMN